MAYRVRFEDRQDYLYAHLSGQESASNAIDFFTELRAKGEKEGYTAFMVVDEVTGKLTTSETLMISREIARIHLGNIIAFVDPKEETFAANSFGGTVVANRGVITNVFSNEREALEWLHENIGK